MKMNWLDPLTKMSDATGWLTNSFTHRLVTSTGHTPQLVMVAANWYWVAASPPEGWFTSRFRRGAVDPPETVITELVTATSSSQGLFGHTVSPPPSRATTCT